MNNVRKNFFLSVNLEKRMLEYCKEYDLSQAQILNLALRNWLDQEDAKKVVNLALNQEAFTKMLIESMEKLGVDVSSLKPSGEAVSS